jgi:release factor glutamine methyltransferase
MNAGRLVPEVRGNARLSKQTLPLPLREGGGGRGWCQGCSEAAHRTDPSPQPPPSRRGGESASASSHSDAHVLALHSTIRAALRDGAASLREAGIDNPRLEARLLLAHALGITGEALLRDPHTPIDRGPYDALLQRRVAHEPLALITGRREFWSLDLAVSAATLIPRADSETLIEAALAALPDRSRVRRILDLGTGTGCLLLAALSEFPGAFGVGTDRSAAAAVLARDNAAMHEMANRAAFVCTDWAAALAGRFDLILSNPPYIPIGELHALMPEVARFEPASALDGGPDGLDAYRRILPVLPGSLTAGGIAVLELGQNQADAVAGLARDVGFITAVRADLAGIPRAMLLTWSPGR